MSEREIVKHMVLWAVVLSGVVVVYLVTGLVGTLAAALVCDHVIRRIEDARH